MFGNLFGEKEYFKVVVINPFEDMYVGMAMDEHTRYVTKGATGIASIKKNGRVKVVFDNIKSTPHTSPLEVYFDKDEARYNDFKWSPTTKEEAKNPKIRKSSIPPHSIEEEFSMKAPKLPFKVDVCGQVRMVKTKAELADAVADAMGQREEAMIEDENDTSLYTSFLNLAQNNKQLKPFGIGIKPLDDGEGDVGVYDLKTEEIYASVFWS